VSDDVKCDSCGKLGRRRWADLAPKDWYYLEARDEEQRDDGETIVVYACSRVCAWSQWREGPGKL
jgi:hypothetical protein